ncbi:hypothetical protein IW262DRAFT_293517 [Armillaria fumosa]|nr:hypothetical protein IW262DRAFT_293517 [Armillaria fumosa]
MDEWEGAEIRSIRTEGYSQHSSFGLSSIDFLLMPIVLPLELQGGRYWKRRMLELSAYGLPTHQPCFRLDLGPIFYRIYLALNITCWHGSMEGAVPLTHRPFASAYGSELPTLLPNRTLNDILRHALYLLAMGLLWEPLSVLPSFIYVVLPRGCIFRVRSIRIVVQRHKHQFSNPYLDLKPILVHKLESMYQRSEIYARESVFFPWFSQ